ncbi:MAG TPA: DUF2190 family protein [Kiritimatiellia bacterium]|nr:DUF2190 family protein [Kiritimatiellia bacterium]
MSSTNYIQTFYAGEALAAKRRVKINTSSPATTTDPPEVVYSDAGEDYIGVTEYAAASGELVAVKLVNAPGSFEIECTVNSAIARGTTLYGAADGKVSDASSGTAQGISKVAAGASGDIIEVLAWNVKSTTAATVSVADTNSNMTGATVEAVLDEIEKALKTAQYTITPDWITAEDGTALTKAVDSPAGVGYAQLSNKSQVIKWEKSATPADLVAHFTLPQDIDDTKDVYVHLLGALGAASPANTPVFTIEAYFDVAGAAPSADTNCGGESGEFSASTDLQEKTLKLAAADVPASPSALTLVLHPKDTELGDVDFYLCGIWLEATRKALTT